MPSKNLICINLFLTFAVKSNYKLISAKKLKTNNKYFFIIPLQYRGQDKCSKSSSDYPSVKN
jgi:hypothetical protein